MTAVTVEGVWKEYGAHVILERVDLQIADGAFCAIVGASGCGKTTFLRMLLGEEVPSRGRILVGDKPLMPEPGPDRGVVFQRYSVFPHLTVLENVMLGRELEASPILGRLFGAARRRASEEAEHFLEAVGLGAARSKYPSALSGGMQQRLALAQTLMKKPGILLLDEPFGALDPGTRKEMHKLLLGLWEETGTTVFLVTHDLSEGFALGTRLLVFDKVRWDSDAPDAYGATITYDIPLDRKGGDPAVPADPANTMETRQ